MIFPVLCPVCQADSGRRIVPLSPEVDTFRCGSCHYQWSEPAAPVTQISAPAPRSVIFGRLWRLVTHSPR